MRFMRKRRRSTITGTKSPLSEISENCREQQSSSCGDFISTNATELRLPASDNVSSDGQWIERFTVSEVIEQDGELGKLLDPDISLSMIELRRDIARFLSAARPLLEASAAFREIILWTDPFATPLFAAVYFYSIGIGYFGPLFFAILLMQLTLNYFKAIHNVDIGLNFLPRKARPPRKLGMPSGQLLIDVGKIAHCAVKFTADVLEKLESLFTWKRPTVTFHFALLCVYWMMWNLFFPTSTCFGVCAIVFGVRLFIMHYLFVRFPRLRYRLDIFDYFYRNSPLKSGNILARPHSTNPRSFPSYRIRHEREVRR